VGGEPEPGAKKPQLERVLILDTDEIGMTGRKKVIQIGFISKREGVVNSRQGVIF